jgi:hypothetical protein
MVGHMNETSDGISGSESEKSFLENFHTKAEHKMI